MTRAEELIEDLIARAKAYGSGHGAPRDYKTYEALEIAKTQLAHHIQDLVGAIYHLEICRTCAEGALEDCHEGRGIKALLELHKERQEFQENPMYCTVCHEIQIPTSSGMVCRNGHGGAPGYATKPPER